MDSKNKSIKSIKSNPMKESNKIIKTMESHKIYKKGQKTGFSMKFLRGASTGDQNGGILKLPGNFPGPTPCFRSKSMKSHKKAKKVKNRIPTIVPVLYILYISHKTTKSRKFSGFIVWPFPQKVRNSFLARGLRLRSVLGQDYRLGSGMKTITDQKWW